MHSPHCSVMMAMPGLATGRCCGQYHLDSAVALYNSINIHISRQRCILRAMHHLILFLLAIYGLLLSCVAAAEDAELAAVFTGAGGEGTIIIAYLNGNSAFVHNDARSRHRFPVASTFKILNTLIALEEGVIADGEEIKWDGVSRDSAAWNQNQTLDSAFRTSCVWCFQVFARKVGAARYEKYLAAIAYGELKKPFAENSFWLDGSLQASAVEQIDILKRIYRRSLPFHDTSYQVLRRIMLVEATPRYSIHAKTGWGTNVDPSVGWYVGYVETAEETWLFALNMEVRTAGELPLRQKITQGALCAKGIIACSR